MPRYALWLRMQEVGLEPTDLSSGEALSFMEGALDAFLEAEGLDLAERRKRRLMRRMHRFDPRQPTPYETMQRLFSTPERRDSEPRA